MEKEQQSLAARLRDGDRRAAVELVDRYYEQIYLFMRRLGHDRQVSEDLTQESFLHVWQHIGQLRHDEMLNSWLYRTAANVSKMCWRKNKGKKVVSIDLIDLPLSNDADESGIGNFEQLVRLTDAVGNLLPKLRQAVVLHYMQDLSISEAAEAAKVSLGTFKSRLNRALRKLRKEVF